MEDPSHKTLVTVKKLKTYRSKKLKEEYDQEVALISRLNHPNIIKLLAITTEENPYCMIFEFMELGRLSSFLRKAKVLDGEARTQSVYIYTYEHRLLSNSTCISIYIYTLIYTLYSIHLRINIYAPIYTFIENEYGTGSKLLKL